MASSSSSGGIGFVGLLQIVFITLKLMGYITWSWFWVLSPMWMSFCIFLLIVASVIGLAWKNMKNESETDRLLKNFKNKG